MNILSVPVRAGEIAIIAENCKPIQIEQLRCSHGIPSATLPFAQGFGLASSWKLEIGAGSFNLDCLAFLAISSNKIGCHVQQKSLRTKYSG